MSLKLKALAGLASLAVAGGVAAAVMPNAKAETEVCGPYCVTMAAQSLGANEVISAGGGASVLMAPGFNPHEDFIGVPVATVAQYAQAGKLPMSLAGTYGREVIYQFAYQPRGAITGECLGTATSSPGAAVMVVSCGDPTTLWIGVHRDGNGNFEPFVNVAASAHSALVLTASTAGGPLSIAQMSISGGVVAGSQMWESLIGEFGQTQPWPTPDGAEPGIFGR